MSKPHAEVLRCVDPHPYRYVLEVMLVAAPAAEQRPLVVVQLNPSTAGELTKKGRRRSDATAGKVQTWARRQERPYTSVVFLNLFAYKATDPDELAAALRGQSWDAVVGQDNDQYIADAAQTPATLVAAWGNAKKVPEWAMTRRIAEVRGVVGLPFHHVGDLTFRGAPAHGRAWNRNPVTGRPPTLHSWPPR